HKTHSERSQKTGEKRPGGKRQAENVGNGHTRHDRVRQRIAHQRPTTQRDETRKERAHRADETAHEDGLHHVLVSQRCQQNVDHDSSSCSSAARFLTISSRPSRLLYSRCPSLPKTTGRSSSASNTTCRAS